jgi:hypothetical protein
MRSTHFEEPDAAIDYRVRSGKVSAATPVKAGKSVAKAVTKRATK